MATSNDASIYAGQTTLIPVVNSFGAVFEEWQEAILNQILFTIVSFQYTPNTNTLLVFRNGLLLRIGVDYLETSDASVTLTVPSAASDEIAFYAFATEGVAIPNGGGVPAGGTAGQALVKIDSDDYNAQWVDLTALASLLDSPIQSVASANTINLLPYTLTTRNLSITGTTAVAGFQITNGQLFLAKAAGNFTLTNSVNLLTPGGLDTKVRNGDSFFVRAFATNQVEIVGYQRYFDPNLVPIGQCRLAKSGANIVLSRFNGNTLPIDGIAEVIPALGVSLAPTGLTVGSNYYIYAAMSAGVMVLEASVTGHSTDATTGVEIKTGDATRTLVGLVRIIAGPNFQDTNAQRFVASYFNRKPVKNSNTFTALRTTASAVNVEINSEIRTEFVTWAATVHYFAAGVVSNDVSGSLTQTVLGLDGVVPTGSVSKCGNPAGINNQIHSQAVNSADTLAEGYHYYTLLGLVGGGGTSSWDSPTIIQGTPLI